MLERILGSKAKIRLLRAIAGNPRREFSIEDLARETGMSYGTAHPALAGLVDARIVLARKAGRSRQYKANGNHILYPQIKSLLDRESAAFMDLAKEFAGRIEGAESVILFGSAARGEKVIGDLDVLIVHRRGRPPRNVGRAVDDMLEKYDVVVSPIALTIDDVEARIERLDDFILRVMDEGKIVRGDARWLRI
ncbi:MAG: helix-turn-helix domain-containing protein [Methanobacteriota archaeon]